MKNVGVHKFTPTYAGSYVYVIFEDGTDMYWARFRVLEYLNQASADLKVIVEIGKQIERILMSLEDTISAYSERVFGGRYLEITPNRIKAARLGF